MIDSECTQEVFDAAMLELAKPARERAAKEKAQEERSEKDHAAASAVLARCLCKDVFTKPESASGNTYRWAH